MDDQNIYLDGAQRLKNVIELKFGAFFKAYFVGSPDVFPEAALPCIVFQKVSGSVSVGATMTDDLTEQIMVHIMVNAKEGFGTSDDDDTMMRQLFTIVEGRDPANGNYLPTSIMYAIRQNLTLTQTVYNHDEQINYDVTPRQNQPNILEAIITVTIYEHVNVLNRT